MVNLEVERLCVGSLDHSNVVPSPLVGLGQGVGPPVRPVHLPSIHGDRKRVGQVFVPPKNLDQARAVVLGRVDRVRSE